MSDPKRFYVGWLVEPSQRHDLLARFPPRYPRVVAHHVTLKFGDRSAHPPAETVGEIVGEADDGKGVQAMVVRIGGTTDRPDGSTYHVTWSLAAGREAKDSNDVIREHGWRDVEPTQVRLQPRTFGG